MEFKRVLFTLMWILEKACVVSANCAHQRALSRILEHSPGGQRYLNSNDKSSESPRGGTHPRRCRLLRASVIWILTPLPY